ncbi:hypothetical protein F2Q69_00013083 [Brassica cretica]|uniref:Uncharacterized protein n=1 Tax=Brassica cretica TaxID=69181 RepID=A0A8S9QTT8_BRACR|nr:hypothetical protein F2Q69_00013083 [Brassica cretica]
MLRRLRYRWHKLALASMEFSKSETIVPCRPPTLDMHLARPYDQKNIPMIGSCWCSQGGLYSPWTRLNIILPIRTDVPQSEDQSVESDQKEVQNVRNNATEVQSIERTGQTDRAVYRLDPHTSGLELQHNPRPDDQINRTEARLSRPVRHAKSIGQAKAEVVGRPNLSKARLLRLSDDIASNWPGTVHENHPSEHEDRTGCILLLTAGRAVGCTESGQG